MPRYIFGYERKKDNNEGYIDYGQGKVEVNYGRESNHKYTAYGNGGHGKSVPEDGHGGVGRYGHKNVNGLFEEFDVSPLPQ